MRRKIPDKPKTGDTRVVKKYLWISLIAGNEERWLEDATIEETYGYDVHWGRYCWMPTKFLD